MDTRRITPPSDAHLRRAEQVLAELDQRLKDPALDDEQGFLEALFTAFRSLLIDMGKPRFVPRLLHRAAVPRSAVLNDAFQKAHADMQLLHGGQQKISEAVVAHFNHAQATSARLRRALQKAGQRFADYMVLAQNTVSKLVTFSESFVSRDQVDITDGELNLSTGTLTLKVTGSRNHSPHAHVVQRGDEEPAADPPYSMPGNFFVAFRRIQTGRDKAVEHLSEAGQIGEEAGGEWDFYHNHDPRDNLQACLDDNPDTWFEWQMINVPEAAKQPSPPAPYPDTRGYNWTFEDGTPIYYGSKDGDELKLRLTVQLGSEEVINWLHLDPYFPEGFEGFLIVDRLETSLDGINFVPVPLDQPTIIGGEGAAGTLSAPLGFPDREKFRGQGVWAVPGRPARYVRFHLRSPQSYGTTIGHLYWLVHYTLVERSRFLFFTLSESRKRLSERVQGPSFSREAIRDRGAFLKTHALEGAVAGGLSMLLFGLGPLAPIIGAFLGFFFSTEREIQDVSAPEPHWDLYEDGWRYCIGVRRIGIHTHTYAEHSTLTTKAFIIPQGVKHVSLSVDEEVPEAFYASDFRTKNEWVRYSISTDGNVWHRISPLEHTPVEEAPFPPKVLSAEPGVAPDARSGERGYFDVDETVRKLYVKIELRRPPGPQFETMTPVVHGFRLRVLPKEVEPA